MSLKMKDEARQARGNIQKEHRFEVVEIASELVAQQADNFYPYHAARADLLRRTNQRQAAAEAYERAIALCGNTAERAYLTRRLDELVE